MTLIVETGSVVAGAESYISVTDADTWHSNRGNTAWAALTTAQKEQSLRKATDYMVGVYRNRWQGYRKDATQTLDWPRSYVYLEPFIRGAVGSYPYLVSDTIVPTEVKNACASLALTAYGEELAPDLDVAVVREKIDVIEVEYDKNSAPYKKFRSIDLMLKVYLKSTSGYEIVPT